MNRKNIEYSSASVGLLMCAVLFIIAAQPVSALGSGEKAERSAVLTESESMEVDVFVIHEEPGSSSAAGVPQPSGQAMWYLFQKVETSGGRVSTAGSREFAGPIDSRDMNRLTDEFMYTRYTMTLEAKTRLSYRNPREVKVSFDLDEMINGSRIALQPQQLAVLKAAQTLGENSSMLMRVKSLSVNGSEWDGVVEIAEEVR